MEWVKRRVFVFDNNDPHHLEKESVIFFRHRSDGTMWYQMSRSSMAGMIHRIPGGWIHAKFKRFLTEETGSPPVTTSGFDECFELEMKRLRGVEVEEF